jgi:hypothetical protein
MACVVANPFGDFVESPTLADMQRFVDGIDVNDVEHGAAWISDDAGNSLELNGDGTLVFEREEVPARHLPRVSKDRVLELWSLLAQGFVEDLEREPWQPGSRPRPPPEEAERRQRELADWQLAEDRHFYDSLGFEDGLFPCRRDNCGRRSISHSVLCRAHHFESIRGRPCPFTD